MLQHGQQVLQTAPQQQQKPRCTLCGVGRPGNLLAAPSEAASLQRRRRKRVSTLQDEQYEQHEQQVQRHSVPWPSQLQHQNHHHQQHQQYTYRVPRNPATLLTSLIASSTTWTDLQAICQTHYNSFGPIHTAAALSKLAKLVRKPPSSQHSEHRCQQQQQQGSNPVQFAEVQGFVRRDLLPLLLSHAGGLGPRGLANSIWALSKLQVVPQPSELMFLFQHLAAVVPELEPQHISSVMYAFAQWQQQQQSAVDMQAAITTSSSSSRAALLAAGGTVKVHQRQALTQRPQQSRQIVTPPSPPAAAAAVPKTFHIPHSLISSLLTAAANTMHAFGPQALSNTLYAAAVLHIHLSNDWLDNFWHTSSRTMAAAEQQHLSNMIWAAAAMNLRPPGYWCDVWLWYSSKGLHAAAAQGLSNSIWGVAKLGWAAAALTPMKQSPSSVSSSSSSSSVVTELDGSGMQDSWLSRFCSSSIEQMNAFSDQALSNCCWAVGCIARQLQQQGTDSSSTTRLNAFQQLLVSSGWHHQLLLHLQPRLLGLNTQQLSNTIWGLASCGITVPKPWLDTFIRVSGPKLMQFKPQELSATLLALARLQQHPGNSWMSLFELSLQRNMNSCSSQVMSNVAWAMVVLKHRPGDSWWQQLLLEVQSRLPTAAAAAAAAATDDQPRADGGDNHGSVKSALVSSSSSSSGDGYAFTSQGWSILLLSLSQLSAATNSSSSSSSSSSNRMQAGVTSLFAALAAHLLTAAAAMNDSRSVLSGYTSQGLSLLAGVAVKAEQQQTGQQLVTIILYELAHRCQQQQQQQAAKHRPRLFPSIEQEQQQQQLSGSSHSSAASVPDSQDGVSSSNVNLTDICMILWAAARLHMQPPAAVLLPLLSQALAAVQQLTGSQVGTPHLQQQMVSSTGSSSSSSQAAGTQQLQEAVINYELLGDGCKQLSAVMYALGYMGFHPGSLWLRSWFIATKPLLRFCGSWALAVLLWATLSLQEVPAVGWVVEWAQAWQQQQQQRWNEGGDVSRGDNSGLQQHNEQQQQQHRDVIACEVAAAAARLGLRLLQLQAGDTKSQLLSQRQIRVVKKLCVQLIRQAEGVGRNYHSS